MAQSLIRIQTQVILILTLCFAGIGFAVYLGLRDMQLTFYHDQASQTVMQASANLNTLLRQQRDALIKYSVHPAIVASVERGSTAELARRAEDIESSLGALSVDVVPWGENITPTMDPTRLDYLRRQSAAKLPAVPEFHVNGTNSYYILAASVHDAQRHRIGYVVASFAPDALRTILEQSTPPGAFLALQQSVARGEPQTVIAVGDMAGDGAGMVIGELSASHWTLLHQPAVLPPPILSGKRVLYFSSAAVGLIIASLVLLHMAHQIGQAIRHDIKSLIRMFSDLREGSIRVSYPMALREFNDIFNYLRDRGQKLVAEKEKLKDMGLIDHLSQLGNRRHFETRLKELFDSSKSNGPSSVLIIDMDHFKQVNDNHGHDAGDALIVGFANALRKVVRQSDVLCRLGGDEFCIIYTYAPLEKAASLADRLRRQLPRDIPLTKGVMHQLRWTGGLSAMHDKDTKPDDVLWRADQALLQAKESGRNNTKTCDPVAGVVAKKSIMAS